MSVELPPGWSAWTTDGRPCRRVVTMGNAERPVAVALGGLPVDIRSRPELDQHVAQLWADAVLYGDAWVDLENRRVCPLDVQVSRSPF